MALAGSFPLPFSLSRVTLSRNHTWSHRSSLLPPLSRSLATVQDAPITTPTTSSPSSSSKPPPKRSSYIAPATHLLRQNLPAKKTPRYSKRSSRILGYRPRAARYLPRSREVIVDSKTGEKKLEWYTPLEGEKRKIFLPNIHLWMVRPPHLTGKLREGQPYNPYEVHFHAPIQLTKPDIVAYLSAVYPELKPTFIKTYNVIRPPIDPARRRELTHLGLPGPGGAGNSKWDHLKGMTEAQLKEQDEEAELKRRKSFKMVTIGLRKGQEWWWPAFPNRSWKQSVEEEWKEKWGDESDPFKGVIPPILTPDPLSSLKPPTPPPTPTERAINRRLASSRARLLRKRGRIHGRLLPPDPEEFAKFAEVEVEVDHSNTSNIDSTTEEGVILPGEEVKKSNSKAKARIVKKRKKIEKGREPERTTKHERLESSWTRTSGASPDPKKTVTKPTPPPSSGGGDVGSWMKVFTSSS